MVSRDGRTAVETFLETVRSASSTSFSTQPSAPEIDLDGIVGDEGHVPSTNGFTPTFSMNSTNDYSAIEATVDDAYDPTKKVSIVVPTYNRKEILEKNLAALVQQNYPHELMEVVIADDGSSDDTQAMVEGMDLPFDVKYVWQKDKGYRAAKIRNEAIKRATHDTIITLDVDMIPTPDLVRQHMMWHHAAQNVAIIGHRRYVELGDVPLEFIVSDPNQLPEVKDTVHGWQDISEDWRLAIYGATRDLKDESRPYRAFLSGNVSLSKRHAFLAGLYDEDFQSWGGEDIEFGNRVYRSGAFLIPDLRAEALHLEHPVPDPKTRQAEMQQSQELLEQKVAAYEPNKFPTPKVSIFVPAYNRETYIQEAIESAAAQTLGDIEIVVCDDGSTDRTPEILEQLQEKYNQPGERPLLRVVRHDTNRGIAAGWNTALRAARGEYFLQLDSDDVLDPTTAEKLAGILDEDKDLACVYGNLNYIDADGNVIQPGWNKPGFDVDFLFNVSMSAHHPRMFRASAWFRTEGANEQIENAVDYDAVIKLAEQGGVHHLEEVLYGYRWHGKQTSQEKAELQQRNARIAQENGRLRRSGEPQKRFYVAGEGPNFDPNLSLDEILQEGVRLRLEVRDKGGAIAAFERYLAQDPDNRMEQHHNAYSHIGAAYRDLGDEKKAVGYFRKALEVKPNHTFARQNLDLLLNTDYQEGVRLRLDVGDKGGAIAALNRYLAADPENKRKNHVHAYNHIGAAYRDMGQVDQAINYFRQALSVDSSNSFARTNMQRLAK